MKIKQFTGIITQSIDLSSTVKEISIKTSEPVDFIPGSFLNVFFSINGERVRRAFSISSSSENQNEVTLAIRLSPEGAVTPLFWNRNMIGEKVDLMGPLGLNTVDKMTKTKIYLFAFGIGAGVVKSLADYFSNKNSVEKLVIVTGSKSSDEILYKKYFSELALKSPRIVIKHTVSREEDEPAEFRGYIQNHIDDFDFNNSDVYVCGQENACNDLVEKIKGMSPENCDFFIEGFH